MNVDAFLFLQRSDIAHYLKSGAAQRLRGRPHIFIDPGLAEEALRQGVDPGEFSYRPLAVGAHFQGRVALEAITLARRIDQRLTALRQQLFGNGVLQGWDQGHLRPFFIRALVAQRLGEVCERSLPEPTIGLFRPSRPQLMYFDSFLATELFAAASERFRIIDHYDEVPQWAADHAAWCFDFAEVARMAQSGSHHAVTHIPTCYQHHDHYQAEIARAFASNIDLPSPYWDIPVRRRGSMRVPLERLPADCIGPRPLQYREAARQVLEGELAALVPGRAALRRQVDEMAQRCFVQALHYEGLLDALRGTQPHFVITDHDTGNNGPLYSVAARLGSPITVLPHASYPTGAIPHSLKVTAVERDGFATPALTVFGEKVAMRPARLVAPVQPVSRERAGTLCLLVNTLASQGLSYIDFAGLARLHRSLAQLCAAHGAELIVRLKPNNAGLRMAASALSTPSETLQQVLDTPLTEIAARTDLCLCYGEPTSAGIEFLASGSLVLHASDQLWPSDYVTAPAYVGDDTVPSLPCDDALALAGALLADPAQFRARGQAQRERFARRLTARDGRLFD